MRLRFACVTVALSALTVTACGASPSGGGGSTPSPTPVVTTSPDPSTRPASPAVLTILQPAQGQVVTGGMVHVQVGLANAEVVAATSAHITPDTGHVHLYLDNELIYMQYRLQQDVPVHPGTYSLKAEFVAADHFPFNPRVWSTQTIVFTVR